MQNLPQIGEQLWKSLKIHPQLVITYRMKTFHNMPLVTFSAILTLYICYMLATGLFAHKL